MPFEYFKTGVSTLDALFRSENQIRKGAKGGIRYFSDGQRGSMFATICGPASSGKTLLALQIAATHAQSAFVEAREHWCHKHPGEPMPNNYRQDAGNRGSVYFTVEQDPLELVETVRKYGWLGKEFKDVENKVLVYRSGTPNLNAQSEGKWFRVVQTQDGNGKQCLACEKIHRESRLPLTWWLFIVEVPTSVQRGLQETEVDRQRSDILDETVAVWKTKLIRLLCETRTNDTIRTGNEMDFQTEIEREITRCTDLVVMDSLPAFLPEVDTRRNTRATLSHVRKILSTNRRHFLCIVEDSSADSDHESAASDDQEYVPAVVIRVGFRIDQGQIAERRFLQLSKGRSQAYPPGRHDLSVLGPNTVDPAEPNSRGPVFTFPPPTPGIHVNASLSWKLDQWASEHQRIRRTLPCLGTPCKLGIPSIDKMFDSKTAAGLLRGTSIGVVAEHGAGSTLLGLHFLAEGIRNDQRENCLLLSFDHDEDSLGRTIDNYGFLGINLGQAQKWSPRFKVQAHTVTRISAERLLQRLEEFLDEMIRKGTPITRCVVDDLGALEKRYPLLAASELLANSLLRLFLSRGVTPLLIDIVPAISEKLLQVQKLSIVETLTENVIVMGNVLFEQQERRAVFIRHAEGQTVSAEIQELVLGRCRLDSVPGLEGKIPPDCALSGGEHTRYVFVEGKAFEAYKGLFTGNPIPVTLRMAMYIDSSTSGLKDDGTLSLLSPVALYKRNIIETLKIGFPQVEPFFFGPFEHATICSALQACGGIPRPDTCILEFDGYWLGEVENQELILPLRDAAPNMSDAEYQRWLDGFLKSTYTKHSNFVPHYVDMGFFLARIEPHEYLEMDEIRIEADGAELEKKRVPPSFEELVEEAKQKGVIKQDFITWRKSPFFDFDRTVPEAKVCMFLELLLTFLSEMRSGFVGKTPKDSSFAAGEEYGALVADVEWLRESARSTRLKLWIESSERNHFNELIADAIGHFKSLFPNDPQVKSHVAYGTVCEANARWQRQWYSTLGAAIARQQGDSLSNVDARRLPNYFVYTGLPRATKNLPKQKGGMPVAGTWHLGIVKGSLSARLGWRAINELTGVQADHLKFAQRVGLPSRLEFYESTGLNCMPYPVVRSPSPRQLKEIYLCSFSRAWITAYRKMSPLLLLCFQELMLAKNDRDAIGRILWKYQQRIDSLYRTELQPR